MLTKRCVTHVKVEIEERTAHGQTVSITERGIAPVYGVDRVTVGVRVRRNRKFVEVYNERLPVTTDVAHETVGHVHPVGGLCRGVCFRFAPP